MTAVEVVVDAADVADAIPRLRRVLDEDVAVSVSHRERCVRT